MVVNVQDDGVITQTVDGRQTLAATVRMLPKRLFFGFYVWEEGVFNAVRVFGAAAKQAVAQAPQDVPRVRQFRSFNAAPLGALFGLYARSLAARRNSPPPGPWLALACSVLCGLILTGFAVWFLEGWRGQ